MKSPPKKFAHDLPMPSKMAAGFSLIELMISIAIGLMIITALIGVVVSSSSASRSNQRTSEVQTNGRYATDLLKHDLRAAGFRGYTWAEPTAPTTTLTPVTGECLEAGATAGAFVSNIRQGVWGTNDSNPFSANCIPAASYARGDVLVVRKLAGSRATALVANTFYFRTSYASGEVFRGAPATACPLPQSGYAAPYNKVPCIAGTPTVDLNNFPIEIYVYYISPFTTAANESPLVPALYRVALQADGSFVRELVASGIEHMQVQYGRATTDLNTRYYSANSITGNSTNTVVSEWDDVNSVRIFLLARNSTTEPGYTNTNAYTLGDQVYAVNDAYRRQIFTSVIQLRN
jgi:type IV pilus assembly protein PilW